MYLIYPKFIEDFALSAHKSNTTLINHYRTVKKKSPHTYFLSYDLLEPHKKKKGKKKRLQLRTAKKQENVIFPRE